MTKKWPLLLIIMFGFLWAIHGADAQPEKPSKILTILYSNNLNGEINPCPT
jgi:hypothetical protein